MVKHVVKKRSPTGGLPPPSESVLHLVCVCMLTLPALVVNALFLQCSRGKIYIGVDKEKGVGY